MTRFTRRLCVRHRTEFRYSAVARDSVNEVRLGPTRHARQDVEYARLDVTPQADVAESSDVWGNRVWWFQVAGPHAQLTVEAETVVATGPAPADPGSPSRETWLPVGEPAYADRWAEFLVPSSLVTWSDETRAFAVRLGVPEEDGVGRWATALTSAVNDALVYGRGATDVTTSVDGVIGAGRGVCQDFAHLYIALCRARGVAARYVSGWLYEPSREGPVESHAWAEVQVPGLGWVEQDPTHPGTVGDRHVRIACGRDYADVVPIKGTYVGGVTESMTVAVEIEELDGRPLARTGG